MKKRESVSLETKYNIMRFAPPPVVIKKVEEKRKSHVRRRVNNTETD